MKRAPGLPPCGRLAGGLALCSAMTQKATFGVSGASRSILQQQHRRLVGVVVATLDYSQHPPAQRVSSPGRMLDTALECVGGSPVRLQGRLTKPFQSTDETVMPGLGAILSRNSLGGFRQTPAGRGEVENDSAGRDDPRPALRGAARRRGHRVTALALPRAALGGRSRMAWPDSLGRVQLRSAQRVAFLRAAEGPQASGCNLLLAEEVRLATCRVDLHGPLPRCRLTCGVSPRRLEHGYDLGGGDVDDAN